MHFLKTYSLVVLHRKFHIVVTICSTILNFFLHTCDNLNNSLKIYICIWRKKTKVTHFLIQNSTFDDVLVHFFNRHTWPAECFEGRGGLCWANFSLTSQFILVPFYLYLFFNCRRLASPGKVNGVNLYFFFFWVIANSKICNWCERDAWWASKLEIYKCKHTIGWKIE